MYTVTNPVGALENMTIDSVLRPGRGSSSGRSGSASPLSAGTGYWAQPTSTGGLRAAEAVEVAGELNALMAVRDAHFVPAVRPVVVRPAPPDPEPWIGEEWTRRKGECHLWQREKRAQLRAEIEAEGHRRAAFAFERAQSEADAEQARVDQWWRDLQQGEPNVLKACLSEALADNRAPVIVDQAEGDAARLLLLLPGPEVLPAKKAHVTPTGRLSSKAWTKTELNEVYAELVAAHLLATVREALAVAPSLADVRVMGLRLGVDQKLEALFQVDVAREEEPLDDDLGRQGSSQLAFGFEARRQDA